MDLLSVLESAFTSRVEKPYEMPAAHIADFVDAIVSVKLLAGASITYRMKFAKSLAVRYPLPALSILWKAA